MEINDADRRRVAKRMREIMKKTPDIYLDRLCFNALRDSLDEGGPIGETLAKLVDRPTCAVMRSKRCYAPGGLNLGKKWFLSCGHVVRTRSKRPEYCADCGAKVVE